MTEDTFVLLDALEIDAEALRESRPALCVEIGHVHLPTLLTLREVELMSVGRVQVSFRLSCTDSSVRRAVRLLWKHKIGGTEDSGLFARYQRARMQRYTPHSQSKRRELSSGCPLAMNE